MKDDDELYLGGADGYGERLARGFRLVDQEDPHEPRHQTEQATVSEWDWTPFAESVAHELLQDQRDTRAAGWPTDPEPGIPKPGRKKGRKRRAPPFSEAERQELLQEIREKRKQREAPRPPPPPPWRFPPPPPPRRPQPAGSFYQREETMYYYLIVLHDADGFPDVHISAAGSFQDALDSLLRFMFVEEVGINSIRKIWVASDGEAPQMNVDQIRITLKDAESAPVSEAKGPRLPLKATLKAKGTVHKGGDDEG